VEIAGYDVSSKSFSIRAPSVSLAAGPRSSPLSGNLMAYLPRVIGRAANTTRGGRECDARRQSHVECVKAVEAAATGARRLWSDCER